MAKPVTIHSLIALATTGDTFAAENLYTSVQKKIMGAVKDHIKNHEDAEEVTQNIGCRMLAGIGALRHPKAFKAWMRSLIEHECCRYFKACSEKLDIEDILDYSDLLPENNGTHLPAGCAELDEVLCHVFAAIGCLSERQQRAIVMRYCHALSYREIADILNVSVSTISTCIMKAKRSIRKRVERSMRPA